jgi:hypothetical protein
MQYRQKVSFACTSAHLDCTVIRSQCGRMQQRMILNKSPTINFLFLCLLHLRTRAGSYVAFWFKAIERNVRDELLPLKKRIGYSTEQKVE